MKNNALGKTGYKVSQLAYGAMRISEEALTADGSSSTLIKALESGINLIDTAPTYNDSEEIIGQTLKNNTLPTPIIATKIAPLPTADFRHYTHMSKAYTPKSITASIEKSLNALQVDALDLVQLHMWYHNWIYESDCLETIEKLKQQGKIKAFGVSARDHEQDGVVGLMDQGLVDSVQLIFNIFESRPLDTVLPLAKTKDIGIICRCVLENGGLSGFLSDEDMRSHFYIHRDADNYIKRVKALKAAFCQNGESLAEIAIRYVLSFPEVSTITMSMPNTELITKNINTVAKGPLPTAMVDDIRHHYNWVKNLYVRSAYDQHADGLQASLVYSA